MIFPPREEGAPKGRPGPRNVGRVRPIIEGYISNDYQDGSYGVSFPGLSESIRAFPTEREASFNIWDWVKVLRIISSDPMIPEYDVILGVASGRHPAPHPKGRGTGSGQGGPSSHTMNRARKSKANTLADAILQANKTRIWVQTGGYWWNGYKPLAPALPFGFSTQTRTITENFVRADLHATFFGPTPGIYVELLQKPSEILPTVIEIKVNGDPYEGNDPFYDNSTAFFFPVENDPLPATFSFKYSYLDLGARRVLTGSGNGPATAMSPRGLAMYPGPENQLLAAMSPNYVSEGLEGVETLITETVASGVGWNYNVESTHDIIEGTLDEHSTFDNLSGATYVPEVDGDTTVRALGKFNAPISLELHVTYSKWDSDPTPSSQDFTATAGQLDFELINTYYGGLEVLVNGIQDELATIAGQIVTLSAPAEDGDDVYIGFVFRFISSPQVQVFNTNGQTEFELLNEPVPGSISVPVLGMDNSFTFVAFDYFGPLSGQSMLVVNVEKKVKFYYVLPAGTGAELTYRYLDPQGELYTVDAMQIREVDVVTTAATTISIPMVPPWDATPPKHFTRDLPVGAKRRWSYGWESQRYGRFAYDPTVDGYTVLSPNGIHHKGRGASGILKTTAWPEEEISPDITFAGFAYPGKPAPNGYPGGVIAPLAPQIKRRTAPDMSVSLAAQYALQGGYGCVGPNKILLKPEAQGGGTGAPSDTDFPIRFLVRDKNKKWNVIKAVSVRSLVKGNKKSFPLFIGGSGIVHREGHETNQGGWATGREGGLIPRNTWWPSLRQTHRWIIGCGWAEADWGKDLQENPTKETFKDYKIGLDDAGYTVNVADPVGTILGAWTYQSTEGYSEDAYVDVHADVAWRIQHTRDFFPNFGTQTAWAGDGIRGWSFAMNTYAFFYYTMLTIDGPAKSPKLLRAGIPALADGEARFCSGAGNYGRILGEGNSASCNIVCDEENCIYLILSDPYWKRSMDEAIVQNTEIVTGVHHTGPISYSSEVRILYDCTGYNGAPIMTQIIDQHDSDGNPYGDKVWPKLDQTYRKSSWISDFSGVTTNFNHQVFFTNRIIERWTTRIELVDGVPTEVEIPIYKQQDFDDYAVPWVHEIPNRAGRLTDYYFLGDPSVHFYQLPGYPELSIFGGAEIWDMVGDCRRRYTQDARTFMIKLKLVGDEPQPVWIKDISQKVKGEEWALPGGGEKAAAKEASAFLRCPAWRPVGKFFLVLRKRWEKAIDTGIPAGFRLVPVLCLEAWSNPKEKKDGEPVLQSRAYLPPLPNPFNYADFEGSAESCEMVVGIDKAGHECAMVSGIRPDGTEQIFQVRYGALATAPPSVSFASGGTPGSSYPGGNNMQGIAEASDYWAWMTESTEVRVRTGE